MSIPNYCIIEPGTLSGKLIADHGCYADMGVKLLKGCLDDFNYATCKVDGGEILPNPDEFDGCLVLGSEHGVNDNLPWIEPLLDFIRQVYDRRIPLVGVCFGHQAIAQSLGGRVEKTEFDKHLPIRRRMSGPTRAKACHQPASVN